VFELHGDQHGKYSAPSKRGTSRTTPGVKAKTCPSHATASGAAARSSAGLTCDDILTR